MVPSLEGSAKPPADVNAYMLDLGRKARSAGRILSVAHADQKTAALKAAAAAIRAAAPAILEANARDLERAKADGMSAAFQDRLALTPARVEAIAAGVDMVAALPDPVGAVTESWTRPNGLMIERVRTPLGVIGVIYESRPNVTADAAALCLRAGNAVILRGGSDSLNSSGAIHAAFVQGLRDAGLPEDAVQFVPFADRAAVGAMLAGLGGNLDVIVPRGGKGLVGRVQTEARVPVFAHLDGIVHVYVHGAADLEMAKTVLLNAKMRRTGICGAAETLLVDEACAATHLAPLVTMLLDAGCEVRGDAAAQAVDPRVKPAVEADWDTEYEDAIISAKVIEGIDAAIAHIEGHGSHHTDSIITADAAAAAKFLSEVDSAIVVHNASTQFADGGEFGFGAEIGIATGRMHARGPVGAEQLTTFKYRVHGTGQTRP
ncbi:glutamate-5-semialdehyde dehydrogenase [Aquabacter sediminis]|uniref:glutamate-5-semialdehyde dehydrogenase n=1 Tax=Aquabacter sediminis TaxID=3029197 RepID=UPI00237ECFD0|nr:glutamate-5-semialdehyde dehydrogenase [Aquabacter sp. P-9]MDE1568918.1 glutamate-5-semialdehyde dehydrogenase [Aquabacter sp. P-9]